MARDIKQSQLIDKTDATRREPNQKSASQTKVSARDLSRLDRDINVQFEV
jgi:hypothetical protein